MGREPMDAEPGTNRRVSRNHLIIKHILRFLIWLVRVAVQDFKVAICGIVRGEKNSGGLLL